MTFHLPNGTVFSCGCYNRERRVKHGLATTPEYKAWLSARSRCTNPDKRDYHRYGGRGIVMADEWMEDFTAFLSHVGTRPTPEHSLDRIDVNGGYVPGNVRWATRFEQASNTRSTIWMNILGERLALPIAAQRYGLKQYIIRGRLKLGWSDEEAVGLVARTRCPALKAG